MNIKVIGLENFIKSILLLKFFLLFLFLHTLIKDNKIKVQTAIQGDQLRVTGKKRDDLQQVIALVRSSDLGQPFQFKNMKD